MTAIDELKKIINLEDLIKRLAFKLDTDLKHIDGLRSITNLRDHTFNLMSGDKIIELMSGTGLIGSQRNHFGVGIYWYTPQAKELYDKLKKEGFYDRK